MKRISVANFSISTSLGYDENYPNRLGGTLATLSVEQHIGLFLDEWMATVTTVADAIKRKDTSWLKDVEILNGMDRSNYVSKAGYRHLNEAAAALLKREHLSTKIRKSTVRQFLVDALNAHLPKALRTNQFSENAIIEKARTALGLHPRDDGKYLFPVVFAPKAKKTDFRIGTARLVAKPVLEAELATAWEELEQRKDAFANRLAEDWRKHSVEFDHYIIVDVAGFEEKMAWPAARDVAESYLNVLRMFFRYAVMDDVRIGDGFIWQNTRSSMRLSASGVICLSTSMGGGVSHLDDDWIKPFDHHLEPVALLLASTVSWPVQHDGRPNPMLERVTYFNRLIAEAYCEPHHPIRLVRLISALEALTFIGAQDKAHNLAHRCGCAGGDRDPHRYCRIYDATKEAYRWRNAVVHGDAPSDEDIMRAFHGLEEHLLDIYIGLLCLLSGIAQAIKPRSISVLRREFGARIDMFFWAPSLVT